MTRFTDEEITAWMDGAADEKLAADLEAAAQDPDVAAQIEALMVPMDALRAGFDAVLTTAPAFAVPAQQTQPARRSLAWPMGLVAASIASFAIGLGVMWTQTRPEPMKWTQRAAIYHALYSPATLAGPYKSESEAQERLAELSAALGTDITAFANVEGLKYRRAQPLHLNGQIIVQIAYQNAAGVPFAICLTAAPAMSDAPVTQELEGMAATLGREGSMGFLVVGGDDQAFTKAVADQVETLL
ncbi:MAG: hypothetical protein AAF393_15380 [Pseudomonadota bacterium]